MLSSKLVVLYELTSNQCFEYIPVKSCFKQFLENYVIKGNQHCYVLEESPLQALKPTSYSYYGLKFRHDHLQVDLDCLTKRGTQWLRNYVLVPNVILHCVIPLLDVHEVLHQVWLLKGVFKRVFGLKVYLSLDRCVYPWLVLFQVKWALNFQSFAAIRCIELIEEWHFKNCIYNFTFFIRHTLKNHYTSYSARVQIKFEVYW